MVAFPKRGEIWIVDCDPAVGAEIRKRRPSLVISNNVNNQFAQTISVLPISDRGPKDYRHEVVLPVGEANLTKDSKIKCHQIRTIDKSRIGKFLGVISSDKLLEAEKTLLIHLGVFVK